MDEVTFRQAYQGLEELEHTLADKATSDAQSADGRELAQARRLFRSWRSGLVPIESIAAVTWATIC